MTERHINHAEGILRRCTYLVGLICVLFPVASIAYVGPGAGLGMIGSLIAVIVAVLVAVTGLFILPIRLLLKRLRRSGNRDSQAKAEGSQNDES